MYQESVQVKELESRMNVFLSTVWDLYFYWYFDCNNKLTSAQFNEQVKLHLSFLFIDNEIIPDLTEAIKELYALYPSCEKDYYFGEKKKNFVERFSKQYLENA